jgi:septal ring factor EnvC (AmiA/AmiB activator)
MKRRFGLGSLLLAPLLVFGLACSDDGNNDDVTLDDREQFEQDAEARLQQIDSEINDLERRIELQGGDAQDDLETELDDLKDERDDLGEKLGDLREASDDEWETLKDDVEDSFDDLDRRLDEF